MKNDTSELELVEVAEPKMALSTLPDNSPAGMMLMALQSGASLENVEKMMILQERYEATQARKRYNVSFSEFKAEAVRIVKATKVTNGPLAGKSYAELYSVVDALTPALSRHGLSASWKLTKDEKDWMEVTCYLRHSDGHEESVSMGGPPDAGGAKNAIQARASTKSYLERYTLKAICGVAEGGEDDDGQGGLDDAAVFDVVAALDAVEKCSDATVLQTVWKSEGAKAVAAKDKGGHAALKAAVIEKKAALVKVVV